MFNAIPHVAQIHPEVAGFPLQCRPVSTRDADGLDDTRTQQHDPAVCTEAAPRCGPCADQRAASTGAGQRGRKIDRHFDALAVEDPCRLQEQKVVVRYPAGPAKIRVEGVARPRGLIKVEYIGDDPGSDTLSAQDLRLRDPVDYHMLDPGELGRKVAIVNAGHRLARCPNFARILEVEIVGVDDRGQSGPAQHPMERDSRRRLVTSGTQVVGN